MRSKVRSTWPPNHTGTFPEAGRGLMPASSFVCQRPLKAICGAAHNFCMTSTCSSERRPRLWKFSLSPTNSTSFQPTPMPRRKRPPHSTSRQAACFATSTAAAVPCCTGPVAYRDRRPLDTDLENLAAACAEAQPSEAFMNAASPGVLTKFVPDTYYKNEDAYVEALADALQQEYEAITRAGFILQIDAPDLGSARHTQYP